jgi:hypothetical protein
MSDFLQGGPVAAIHYSTPSDQLQWLHASLAATAQKGYWGPAYPASSSPTESDIRNAAKLLTDTYAANRLYLVYHGEITLDDAEQVFRWWRRHCPQTVTLVPEPYIHTSNPRGRGRLAIGLR